MKNLAGMLLHFDVDAQIFFKAVNKEINKYFKERDEKAKEGWFVE